MAICIIETTRTNAVKYGDILVITAKHTKGNPLDYNVYKSIGKNVVQLIYAIETVPYVTCGMPFKKTYIQTENFMNHIRNHCFKKFHVNIQ